MNLILIIKGFIIGLAKVIPGVSGSMMAITLGIYETLIEAITNFFGNIKKNFKILSNFIIGLFLAIIIGSKLLLWLLNNFYYESMFCFLGLIIGTLIPFIKQVKINTKKHLGIFILVLLISLSLFMGYKINISDFILNNKLYIALLGFIDAMSSIIPGISGTAIYMLLNSYQIVLNIMANPFSINFLFYLGGLMGGIILICYLMAYLLKKHKNMTSIIILGLMVSSLIKLFLDNLTYFKILGIIYLLLGIFIGYFIEKIN